MSDISYIVVNGVQYPVVDGTTVNINGTSYTIQDLLALAESPTEQPVITEPEHTTEHVVIEDIPDAPYYIVVDGVRYPLADGATVRINGTSYTADGLIALAEEQQQQQDQQPIIIIPEPTQEPVVIDSFSDVSFVVVNGTKYAIDDLQATTDLQTLSDSIAEQYSDTKTYSVGDFCIKDGALYTCSTAIVVPEEWDEEHWISAVLSQCISERQSYNWGNGIAYDVSTNTISVDVVDDAIEDETRPISSNGVWKELGNVAVLLGTI